MALNWDRARKQALEIDNKYNTVRSVTPEATSRTAYVPGTTKYTAAANITPKRTVTTLPNVSTPTADQARLGLVSGWNPASSSLSRFTRERENEAMARTGSEAEALKLQLDTLSAQKAALEERLPKLRAAEQPSEVARESLMRTAQGWSQRQELEEPERGSDRVSARIEALDQEYNSLLPQYYAAKNEATLRRMEGDGALKSLYAQAKGLREDLDRAALAQTGGGAAGAQGDGGAAGAAWTDLQKKYGVSRAAELPALHERLLREFDALEEQLAAQGVDYEYLRAYEQMAEDRTAWEEKQAETETYAREHPVMASVESVLKSPMQGLDLLSLGTPGAGRNDPDSPDTYVPLNVYGMDVSNFVNTVRGTVSEEIEKNTDWELFGRNVASFLYQTGMSVADSAAQVALFGPGATYLMGASAAANQAREVIERGGTNRQALLSGLAAGAAEALFEKVSIDSLLATKSVTGWKSWLKETMQQAGTEASEEMLTEVSNLLSDAAIMGSGSNFATMVERYETQGLSGDEAKRRAFLDCLSQVSLAGVGGALSGGMMGGMVRGANYLSGAWNQVQSARASRPTNAALLDSLNQHLSQPGQVESDLRPLPFRSELENRAVQTLPMTDTRPVTTLPNPSASQTVQSENAAPWAAVDATGQNNTASSGEAEQLTSEDNMNRYKAAVDGVFTGTLPSGSDIVLGKTPFVLQQYGAPALNLHMTQSVARKIAYPFGYMGGKHNLGLSALKNLPYQLADPIAIIENPQRNSRGLASKIVLTEWNDMDGKPVIVPIHLNAQGAVDVQNDIASAFGADYIRRIIGDNGENVLYTKNNEDIDQLLSKGRPVPQAMADDVLAKNSIDHATPNVKVEGISESGASLFQSEATSQGADGPLRNDAPLGAPGGAPTTAPIIADSSAGGNTQSAPNGPESSVGAAQAGFLGDTERGFSRNLATDRARNPDIQEDFQLDPEMYHRLGNQETLDKANAILGQGFEHARVTLENALSAAQRGRKLAPEMVPLSKMVADQLAADGDMFAARSLLSSVAVELTEAGQLGQAAIILRNSGPAAKVMVIEKLADRLSERFRAEITVSDELLNAYATAEDANAQDAALDAIYQDIADQLPSSFGDKFHALRYMNMLGNLKTQVKNISGNIAMRGIADIKNKVAATIEAIAAKRSGGDFQRTTTFLRDKELYQAAKADFESIKKAAMGAGRYTDTTAAAPMREINERRTIFKNNGTWGTLPDSSQTARLARKITDAAWKLPEAYRRGTNWLMNNRYFGDEAFSRIAYADALSRYLKANGITAEQFKSGAVDQDIVDKARERAVREAQEATFRDNNQFSEMISSIGFKNANTTAKKAANIAVQGTLPFLRTPANVAVRAVEYSPLGIINTAVQSAKSVRKGSDITGADIINSLSKSLTGTGIFALGAFLYNLGYLSGGGGDDDKQKEIDDLTGAQEYALTLPNGKSYTLDWLAPVSMPLFMGVEWARSGEDGGLTMEEIGNSIKSMSEVLLNMSMLDGINKQLSDVSYSEYPLPYLMLNSLAGYLTQGFTNTLLGQLERTVEDKRMSTYSDKNFTLPTDIQYALGKASAKTPLWDYQQIPYIDAWGREEKTGTLPMRAFNNFVNPAYTSSMNVTPVDEEVQRLYNATGNGAVVPSRPNRYITVDKTRINLSKEQYVQYATERGQTQFSMLEDLLDSPAYAGLSDEEKAAVVDDVYTYADAVAKAGISDYEPEDWMLNVQNAKMDLGVSPAEYIMLHSKYGGGLTEGDKVREAYQVGIPARSYLEYAAKKKDTDGSGGVSTRELVAAIENSGLPRSQKTELFFVEKPEWKEQAEEHGIDGDLFIQFKIATDGIAGDKGRDGKTIPNSKKKKVMDAINRLEISKEEKDALYYAAGYSASTIRDAPWR